MDNVFIERLRRSLLKTLPHCPTNGVHCSLRAPTNRAAKGKEMKTLIIMATLLFSAAASADVYVKLGEIKGEVEEKAVAEEVTATPDRIEASAARTVTNTGEETAGTEAAKESDVDYGEKHRPETVVGKAEKNLKVTLGDLPCSNTEKAADNKCDKPRKESR